MLQVLCVLPLSLYIFKIKDFFIFNNREACCPYTLLLLHSSRTSHPIRVIILFALGTPTPSLLLSAVPSDPAVRQCGRCHTRKPQSHRPAPLLRLLGQVHGLPVGLERKETKDGLQVRLGLHDVLP